MKKKKFSSTARNYTAPSSPKSHVSYCAVHAARESYGARGYIKSRSACALLVGSCLHCDSYHCPTHTQTFSNSAVPTSSLLSCSAYVNPLICGHTPHIPCVQNLCTQRYWPCLYGIFLWHAGFLVFRLGDCNCRWQLVDAWALNVSLLFLMVSHASSSCSTLLVVLIYVSAALVSCFTVFHHTYVVGSIWSSFMFFLLHSAVIWPLFVSTQWWRLSDAALVFGCILPLFVSTQWCCISIFCWWLEYWGEARLYCHTCRAPIANPNFASKGCWCGMQKWESKLILFKSIEFPFSTVHRRFEGIIINWCHFCNPVW